jgi:hypothetical protein
VLDVRFYLIPLRLLGELVSITGNEAKQISELISPIFNQHLAKYSFKKYPAVDYARFKEAYSKMDILNEEIYGSLVWKWGHVGKDNFPLEQKELIKKIEKLWPDYVENKGRATAKDTFIWWKAKLPITSYITAAYITHLVHHADLLPIIDQHNFRAMNHFIKQVKSVHKANKTPRSWDDISELKSFMTGVLEHLPEKNFDELDRFLMMYGRSIKPRKQKTKKP